MRRRSVIVIVAWAALAAGCGGQRLRLENVRKIQLGTTTASELDVLIGKPDQYDRTSDDKHVVEVRDYVHVGNPYASIVSADGYKSAAVELVDGRVNGYAFDAQLQRDQAGFDPAAVADTVVGRSTRVDVERTLGVPSLKVRRPTRLRVDLAAWPASAVELWGYASVSGGPFDSRRAIFSVYFDARGIVTDKVKREIH